MAAGKPFTKPTDAQRDAFGEALKEDGFALLKRAAGAGIEYLRDTPESPIRQTIQEVEQSTGAVTVFTRLVAMHFGSRVAPQGPAAAPKSAPTQEPGPDASKVHDAEFVDEK
jgi:hypothetical protein